jgi:hypothetical protein
MSGKHTWFLMSIVLTAHVRISPQRHFYWKTTWKTHLVFDVDHFDRTYTHLSSKPWKTTNFGYQKKWHAVHMEGVLGIGGIRNDNPILTGTSLNMAGGCLKIIRPAVHDISPSGLKRPRIRNLLKEGKVISIFH